MRVKNTTARFQAFVQNLQESFWGEFQGRTQQVLKKLLESDAELQMAEYLGLKCPCTLAEPGQRKLPQTEFSGVFSVRASTGSKTAILSANACFGQLTASVQS